MGPRMIATDKIGCAAPVRSGAGARHRLSRHGRLSSAWPGIYRRRGREALPYLPLMEGYSVEEAATVLGVPKGRVWELLARGVLAGTPEDDGGMRVYLRGTTAAIPSGPQAGEALDRADTGTENGNGKGDHNDAAFEASPFRELLTEFRNLTERYGQALLALGEARGEVAGLRTRVEVLEARLDLRLPGPSGWASDWAAPSAPEAPGVQPPPESAEPAPPGEPPEPASTEPVASADGDGAALQETPSPQPAVPADAGATETQAEAGATETRAEASPPSDAGEPPATEDRVEPEPDPEPGAAPEVSRRPRRRRQGSRSAVSGIAEALARAEDPTVAQLPGAEEAAQALASLQREQAAGTGPLPMAEPGVTTEALLEPDQLTAPASVAPSAALPEEEVASGAAAEVEEPMAGEPSPEAEAMTEPPTSEVEEPVGYSSEWDEPDWIAEEDIAGGWEPEPSAPAALSAAEPVPVELIPAEAEVDTAEPVPAEADAETATDVAAEADADTGEPVPAEADAEEPHEEADASRMMPEPESEAPEIAVPSAASDDLRTIPEMAAWPAPPEEEIAAEIEGLAAQEPTTSIGDAADATDDYLLLYEPAAESVIDLPEPDVASEPVEPPRGVSAASSDAYEEELMWLGDEFRPSTTAWSGLGEAETAAVPEIHEEPQPSAEDEELDRLARLRGWDDAELSAIRSLLGEHPGPSEPQSPDLEPVTTPAADTAEPTGAPVFEPPIFEPPVADAPVFEPPVADAPSAWAPPAPGAGEVTLPGAEELDEALASLRAPLEAVSVESPAPPPVQPDTAEPAMVPESPSSHADGPETSATAAAPQRPSEPLIAPPPAPAASEPVLPTTRPHLPGSTNEDWLHGRRGPAANAYRRLRRLFPG